MLYNTEVWRCIVQTVVQAVVQKEFFIKRRCLHLKVAQKTLVSHLKIPSYVRYQVRTSSTKVPFIDAVWATASPVTVMESKYFKPLNKFLTSLVSL